MRRRSLLAAGAPLLLLGACGARDGAAVASYDGGWVGASHERGHRLRDAVAARAPAPTLGARAETRRCAVAIVGAGIAGLAAARALLRAGIDDVRVFELEDEAGGNSRGHSIGGIACPLGAHYLPLPGPDAHEVAEWLHDIGLARHEHGRTVYDARHLCHSPQERLWIDGRWHEGLLPPAAPGSLREAQYRGFARLVGEVSRELRFTLPSARAGWSAGHAALDATTFAQWLDRHRLDDAALHWYLDYACLDDYGADSRVVSAWAGLHYFASRHGFAAPGDDDGGEGDAVLTWPEGNAWLARRLAEPLGERLLGARVVQRIDEGRHGVVLDAWNARDDSAERWSAAQVIVATPLHVAARIVAAPPPALVGADERLPHAPWLVANLHLRAPLTDKPGAPPAWDNVLYEEPRRSASLGYVDAMHQSLRPLAGPTVLSAYWALGGSSHADAAAQRRRLLDEPWRTWAQRVLDDLARAHPDLPRKVTRIDLMRYGHAMAIPAPGVRGDAALAALARPSSARLHFAHSDLAGYSVFEEAFHFGHAAGQRVAAAERR